VVASALQVSASMLWDRIRKVFGRSVVVVGLDPSGQRRHGKPRKLA
jgi:hypothetical protein